MTPRELADACCDECRALPGDGPWCPRCGRENDATIDPDTICALGFRGFGWFTLEVCTTCESEIA